MSSSSSSSFPYRSTSYSEYSEKNERRSTSDAPPLSAEPTRPVITLVAKHLESMITNGDHAPIDLFRGVRFVCRHDPELAKPFLEHCPRNFETGRLHALLDSHEECLREFEAIHEKLEDNPEMLHGYAVESARLGKHLFYSFMKGFFQSVQKNPDQQWRLGEYLLSAATNEKNLECARRIGECSLSLWHQSSSPDVHLQFSAYVLNHVPQNVIDPVLLLPKLSNLRANNLTEAHFPLLRNLITAYWDCEFFQDNSLEQLFENLVIENLSLCNDYASFLRNPARKEDLLIKTLQHGHEVSPEEIYLYLSPFDDLDWIRSRLEALELTRAAESLKNIPTDIRIEAQLAQLTQKIRDCEHPIFEEHVMACFGEISAYRITCHVEDLSYFEWPFAIILMYTGLRAELSQTILSRLPQAGNEERYLERCFEIIRSIAPLNPEKTKAVVEQLFAHEDLHQRLSPLILELADSISRVDPQQGLDLIRMVKDNNALDSEKLAHSLRNVALRFGKDQQKEALFAWNKSCEYDPTMGNAETVQAFLVQVHCFYLQKPLKTALERFFEDPHGLLIIAEGLPERNKKAIYSDLEQRFAHLSAIQIQVAIEMHKISETLPLAHAANKV